MEEQNAVANVLYNLADADFQNDQSEEGCLDSCMRELEFDTKDFVPIPRNELQHRVYDTIRHMSKEKKRTFSRMMTRLSRSDANFGPSERAFVKEVLIMCDVPFVHK